MSMDSNNHFLCPKCERFTGWGTSCPDQLKSGGIKWSTALGHCHGTPGTCCGFTWLRRDDWKYFVSMRRYKDKKDFVESNPMTTVTR
jgi:hypothetical protein